MEIKSYVVEVDGITGQETVIDLENINSDEKADLLKRVVDQGLKRAGYFPVKSLKIQRDL